MTGRGGDRAWGREDVGGEGVFPAQSPSQNVLEFRIDLKAVNA